LFLDARARHSPRRRPIRFPISPVALIPLALLLWFGVRVVQALVTPLAPADVPSVARTRPVSFAGFDPFFRGGAEGSAEVTGLDLKLFGVRQDRASGRGSAIIGLPGGSQASVMVGEAIVPGVTLQAVDFDSVTLGRDRRREMLFLDQSRPAAIIGEAGR
jgi:general secretion pathway protein C